MKFPQPGRKHRIPPDPDATRCCREPRRAQRPARRSPCRLPVDEVVRWEDDRLVRLEARLLDDRHQLLAECLELLGRLPDVEHAKTAGCRADDVGKAATTRPVRQRVQQLAVVQPSADLVVLLGGSAWKVEDHTDCHELSPDSVIRAADCAACPILVRRGDGSRITRGRYLLCWSRARSGPSARVPGKPRSLDAKEIPSSADTSRRTQIPGKPIEIRRGNRPDAVPMSADDDSPLGSHDWTGTGEPGLSPLAGGCGRPQAVGMARYGREAADPRAGERQAVRGPDVERAAPGHRGCHRQVRQINSIGGTPWVT